MAATPEWPKRCVLTLGVDLSVQTLSEVDYTYWQSQGWRVEVLADGVVPVHPIADAAEPQGWREMTAQEWAAWQAAHPPPFPVLTRKQVRYMILQMGLSSAAVEAQIAAIPDPAQREAALIEWQDSAGYHRDHPLVAQIGAALGLTPEEIDTKWRAAAER